MKKWFEFSKIILMVLTIFGIRWVEMSYALAAQGYDSNAQVTTAVVSFMLAATYGAYSAKSYGEKNSRNKNNYHLPEENYKGEKYSKGDIAE